MCKLCKKAFNKVKKKWGKDVADYWLWNETAFPFCSGEEILKEADICINRKLK